MVSKVRNVRLGVFSGGGCHHPNNGCVLCEHRTDVEFDLSLKLKLTMYLAAIGENNLPATYTVNTKSKCQLFCSLTINLSKKITLFFGGPLKNKA